MARIYSENPRYSAPITQRQDQGGLREVEPNVVETNNLGGSNAETPYLAQVVPAPLPTKPFLPKLGTPFSTRPEFTEHGIEWSPGGLRVPAKKEKPIFGTSLLNMLGDLSPSNLQAEIVAWQAVKAIVPYDEDPLFYENKLVQCYKKLREEWEGNPKRKDKFLKAAQEAYRNRKPIRNASIYRNDFPGHALRAMVIADKDFVFSTIENNLDSDQKRDLIEELKENSSPKVRELAETMAARWEKPQGAQTGSALGDFASHFREVREKVQKALETERKYGIAPTFEPGSHEAIVYAARKLVMQPGPSSPSVPMSATLEGIESLRKGRERIETAPLPQRLELEKSLQKVIGEALINTTSDETQTWLTLRLAESIALERRLELEQRREAYNNPPAWNISNGNLQIDREKLTPKSQNYLDALQRKFGNDTNKLLDAAARGGLQAAVAALDNVTLEDWSQLSFVLTDSETNDVLELSLLTEAAATTAIVPGHIYRFSHRKRPQFSRVCANIVGDKDRLTNGSEFALDLILPDGNVLEFLLRARKVDNKWVFDLGRNIEEDAHPELRGPFYFIEGLSSTGRIEDSTSFSTGNEELAREFHGMLAKAKVLDVSRGRVRNAKAVPIQLAEAVPELSHGTMPSGLSQDTLLILLQNKSFREHVRGLSQEAATTLFEGLNKLTPIQHVNALKLATRDLSTVKSAGMNLVGVNLQSLDLRGVDLTNADLRGANLRGANLKGANLENATLSDAILIGAVLTEANAKEAKFNEAKLQSANLDRATLVEAKFWKANFGEASLVDADLTEANLDSADFLSADLTRANLTRANLTDVGLTDADLTDVIGLP